MINLLPPDEKQALLLEDNKKLIIILGITCLIPLACFVLILLSIHFYILGEINAQKVTLERAKTAYQTPDFLSFQKTIQESNDALNRLASFYATETSFSQALKTISGIIRPGSVYVTNIALQKDKSGNIAVTAAGFSASREDLLDFQKSIREHQEIKNLSFSPESWIAPKNITFNATFNVAAHEK